MVRTRSIALMAVFVALAWALGLLFMHIPNVELITFAVFASGCLLGARRGAAVGATAMGLYSGLNPMGMPFPPVFAAQVFATALVGAVGGLTGPLLLRQIGRRRGERFVGAGREPPGLGTVARDEVRPARPAAHPGGRASPARPGAGSLVILYACALGFALTLVYQAAVIGGLALSSPNLRTGFIAAVVSNAYFSLVHLISNTVVFAVLVPIALPRMRRVVGSAEV